MNRRKFFRAAASFVAGCAIGLGLRPKIEPVPQWEGVIIGVQIKQVTDEILYFANDGVRSFTYSPIHGRWMKHESTRKA